MDAKIQKGKVENFLLVWLQNLNNIKQTDKIKHEKYTADI